MALAGDLATKGCSVVNLNAKIPNRAFQLRVSEKKLNDRSSAASRKTNPSWRIVLRTLRKRRYWK
jgi:hypothetical protein